MKTIFLLALVVLANSHKICREKTDCDSLGNLMCIKSMCEWGICGCMRGYAARYLGSERNFQCVPIRKIGESCSTDGDKGACGAANSQCKDEKCRCMTGYESRWGGETCLSIKLPYTGETCTTIDGLTNKACSGSSCTIGNNWWIGALDSPLDNVPNVCACAPGYQTTLPNDYSVAPFTGRKEPNCMKLKVGDLCIVDRDCEEIQSPSGYTTWDEGGAVCTDNKCVCADSAHVADIDGTRCAKPLGHGSVCASPTFEFNVTGHCNGVEGLRCGDVCKVDQFNALTKTCACDPGWKTSGTTCTKVSEGDACNGDYNCKSFGMNAICVDGQCANGAMMAGFSTMTLLLPLVVIGRLL